MGSSKKRFLSRECQAIENRGDRGTFGVALGLSVVLLLVCMAAADTPVDTAARLADELATRRFAARPESTRGAAQVFDAAVASVVLIVSSQGFGTGVVTQIDSKDRLGAVVTNEHVVSDAFVANDGRKFVIVVFYEPRLADQGFDRRRVFECIKSKPPTEWCRLFSGAYRYGWTGRSDIGRDLALIFVPDLPLAARPVTFGKGETLRVGDDLAVIGHPHGLLWSLTTGIVSAIRAKYVIPTPGNSTPVAVIQTQAPVNSGNSGGPVLDGAGRLVGVVSASIVTRPAGGSSPAAEVVVPGLHFAVAVSEVVQFLTSR